MVDLLRHLFVGGRWSAARSCAVAPAESLLI
jgi:hypothetical protein